MLHSFDHRFKAEDLAMWLPVKRTVAAGFIASLGLPACSAADSGFIDIVTKDKPTPPPKLKDMCDVDGSCPPMTPYCDPTNHCVECGADAGCADPNKPVCSPATAACVECASDAHCAMPRPYCNIATSKCVECTTDQNCAAGQMCDPMQHCAP